MDLWNRQIKLAQYMLLGTVIITAVNLAFLLGNSEIYVTYCAALPYYLVWLGKVFDNGLYIGAVNGAYTAAGLVMAGVLLALWLLVWWLSRDRKKWLKLGMMAVLADLALLIAAGVFLFGDVMSCLWEIGIHIAVAWEIHQGLKAWDAKDAALAAAAQEPVLS